MGNVIRRKLGGLCWTVTASCAAGVPLLVLGCTELEPVTRTASCPGSCMRELPHPAPPSDPSPAKSLPVSLDTVLRLADEHNAQIRLAREKVRADESAGASSALLLPDIYLGPAWYRHEGGIQNP